MKIAVSYEDGNIFQHFGHSKMFKIYEIDGQNIVDTKIIEAQGSGHSALATMLDDINVDALICGGIGNGAMEALVQMGIEVCSGVSGDADEAVAEYLNGSLESQGVNCDHHNNGEEHSCGHCGSDEEACGCGSCGDDDGHGCGGCSGCGGSYTPLLMVLMSERHAGCIIREPSTMEHSLTHLMTGENHWSSYVVLV